MTPKLLQMTQGSVENNLDMTVEVYPWTAGMTEIKSAIFSDGWQESFGLDYGDLQWGETGERLTKETFQKYREKGGLVIVHSNPESVVTQAVAHPLTMIASDGLKGHPRNAGSFARILGYYVREQQELDLSVALEKISLMPARRLENRVDTMKNKGRVQVGADADLTLFDPETVKEAATFTNAKQPSKGIPFVIVSGTIVVEDGEIVEGMADLKQYLVEQKSEAFARALTARMTSYALGRDLEFTDEEIVDKVAEDFVTHDFRLSYLIQRIAGSELFFRK